jgi:hypothetical protein
LFNLTLNLLFYQITVRPARVSGIEDIKIPEGESPFFAWVSLIFGTCCHEASVRLLIAIGMVYRETYIEVSQTAVSVMTAIPEVDSED